MKKNLYITIFSYILIVCFATSQTIDFNWGAPAGNTSGSYGSICLAMTKDNIGNVYCLYEYSGTNVDFNPGLGTALLTSNGDRDIAIVSFNSAGNFLWVKGIGGIDRELPRDIFWSNNCLYVVGSFSNTVDFDPNSGVENRTSFEMWDIFMLKLTDNGNFLWVNTFGGSGHDEGWQIKSDNVGNVIITCGITSTVDMNPGLAVNNLNGLGTYDAVVAKYDANGNYIWAKKIGNTGYDYPYSLGIDNSNNIYYGGIFQGTVDFDPGPGVQNRTGSGGTDGFVASLDANGDYRWANIIYSSYVYSIALDNANNVVITGYFSGTQDFDPGSGIANLTSNSFSSDSYLAKYTSGGNFTWAFATGGTNFDYGYEISIDMTTNEIYVCGAFDGASVDFDPSVGVYNQTSSGRDMYFACYTSSGTFKWARRPTGSGSDNAYYILFDDVSESIYLGGGFGATVNFNVEGGTNNLTASGNPTASVVRYLQNTPLPIELANFSANCSANNIEFSWSTYSETNNSFFSIEKSRELIFWEEIVRVNGAGSSNSIISYNEFWELDILNNEEKYFRLKQTDFNGQTTYFSPVVVDCNLSNSDEQMLIMYPNPTYDKFTILIEDKMIQKVEILDLNGRVLWQMENISQLNNIDIENFPTGMYIVHAYSKTEVFSSKLVKK